MPKEESARQGFTPQARKTSLRWKYGALTATVLVWLAVAISAAQSWWSLKAIESRTYSHLVDTSHEIEQALQRLLAENRTLARAMLDQLSAERERASDPPCRLICNEALLVLKRRYAELFPGLELLVMDPQGQVVAATETDMQNHIGGLGEVATHFRSDRNAQGLSHYAKSSRNEHALLLARSQRSPAGDLLAICVIVQPMSMVSGVLAAPQLGPGRVVTLAEASGVLLMRDPLPELIQPGQQVTQYLDESRPGRGAGSFRAVSKLDGVDRLLIKREIPFPLSSGSLVLWVGMSTDDYLVDWRRSTLLTAFGCFALLVGWLWGQVIFRRDTQFREQLLGSVNLMNKVIESAPVPTVVVSQQEGRVVMNNAAMLNAFGSLAAIGQPVQPIFGSETLPERQRDSDDMAPQVMELLARTGPMHVELHRTDLGNLSGVDGPCSLLILVDVSERHKREQRLKHAATTDVLTGLINRRHFSYEAEQAIAAARQQGTSLAVLALDLDHFKRVNDEHGHDIGDTVLATVAGVIKGVLREGDLAARMGGEEFAALLPKADRHQAATVAERIRRAVAATPILLPDDKTLGVTLSIGVGIWQAEDDDINVALKRADVALYAAKEKGRNRVETGETRDALPAREASDNSHARSP